MFDTTPQWCHFPFTRRTTFAFHMNCRINLSVPTKMFALIVIRIALKLYINLERTACDGHCHLSLYLTKYFVSLDKSFQLNLLFLHSSRSKCNCKEQHREIPHVLYPVSLIVTSWKTIVLYHNQDIDINKIKKQNVFIITRISHVAFS